MRKVFPLIMLLLLGATWAIAQTSLCSHLNQAVLYEGSGDPRAEQEFRLSLEESHTCPDAYLIFSYRLSRQLRFQEAADLMEKYVKLEYRRDWKNLRDLSQKDLLDLRKAARLKKLVDDASKPALDDLVELTHLVDGFGEHKGQDAMPYAEEALALYPDSAEAILSFAKLKMPSIKNDEETKTVKRLLDRAAVLAPENAEVHSTRGSFYYWRLRRAVDAEIYFHRALELSDNRDTASWKGLGYICRERGQRQEAISALQTYLRLLKAKGAPVDTVVRDDLHSLVASGGR